MRPGFWSAVVVASVCIGGCDTERTDSDRMVRTGAPKVEVGANGRLNANPAPLTLKDLSRFKSGSAEAAVMQLLFWTQWGNLPSIVDAYDPRVVRRLGVSNLTGAYSWLRPQIASSKAQLLLVRRRGTTRFVGIELLSKDADPTRESFLLRRSEGEWRILYDSLLEQALKAHTVARLSGDSPRPSSRVVKVAERAAQQYRDIYPSIQFSRRARPSLRQP